MESEIRKCQNCTTHFTIEPDDFSFYEKMQVPPPTFCPECRFVRRMLWRNNRSLHKRSCDLCGKSMITIYRPDAPFPVYCNPCWWGDGWDALSYGVDIDWSRPFLEQWFELWNAVPKFARWATGNIKNSDYSNNIANCTDTYLSYSTVGAEEVMYSENIDDGKALVDSFLSIKSNTGYEIQGTNNYQCMYTSQSQDNINCKFIFDCNNCQDCFMSSNLRNKRYVFRNKQLSKEAYEQAILEENTGSRKKLDELVFEWKKEIEGAIHRYARIVACQNTTGNFIRNSKNAKESYMSHELEDAAYTARSFRAKDFYDAYGFADGELAYEVMGSPFGAARVMFSLLTTGCQDLSYTAMCQNANALFGSVAIRKKDYCILNKQYTKEEYQALVPKIIEHMNAMPYVDSKGRVYKYGEFFPAEMSPFGYNETQAHDFFQITKEEAEQAGYNWYSPKEREGKATIASGTLPDNITDVTDAVTSEVLACAHSGSTCNQQCTEAFRITVDELAFYRKMNIALPRLCPNCRYYERLPVLIQPLKLWPRSCMCDQTSHGHENICPNEFQTSYAPERKETLYCESCYQKEVI